MLIVTGEARALPGRREELLAAARAVAEATRDDHGCESYGFFIDVDVDDADTVLSLEFWLDQAALDAHMEYEHTKAFLARVPGLVQGEPSMTVYEASPAG